MYKKIEQARASIKNQKDSVPMIEQRHFIRHPLSIPLTYKVMKKKIDKNKKGIPGQTVNVSIGGLLFLAKEPIGVDALIMIKMPFEDRVFNVRAKVVHCTKNEETKLYNVGVSFYKFRDAYKVKLVEQIYLIAEYRDLRTIQLGKDITLEEASREWIKRYAARFKRLYW